jgi:hypothetical protein
MIKTCHTCNIYSIEYQGDQSMPKDIPPETFPPAIDLLPSLNPAVSLPQGLDLPHRRWGTVPSWLSEVRDIRQSPPVRYKFSLQLHHNPRIARTCRRPRDESRAAANKECLRMRWATTRKVHVTYLQRSFHSRMPSDAEPRLHGWSPNDAEDEVRVLQKNLEVFVIVHGRGRKGPAFDLLKRDEVVADDTELEPGWQR